MAKEPETTAQTAVLGGILLALGVWIVGQVCSSLPGHGQ